MTTSDAGRRAARWAGSGARRLSKDYEATCESSEAWICLPMIHNLLRRLDR